MILFSLVKISNGSYFSHYIVTEVRPLTDFYEAEEYHRNYYRDNSSQPYCQIVISPKLEKLQKSFAEFLKSHVKS